MPLRDWLFKNRMTVATFARLMLIDRSYVYMWFSGKKRPSLEMLGEIKEFTIGQVSTYDDLLEYRGKLAKEA